MHRGLLAAGALALLAASALLALQIYGDEERGPGRAPPAPAAAAPEAPRNVVLIVIDTLRADHLGAYGYERRPTSSNLDRLAQQAFLFERAYSPSSWTRTAVASLLTSRHPSDHLLLSEDLEETLPDRFTTLQEYLGSRGYSTAAFITNPQARFGLEQGFEHDVPSPIAPASVTYDAAMRWVEQSAERPFFLFVHNIDPHDPWPVHRAFPWGSEDPRYRRVKHQFENGEIGDCPNRDRARRLEPDEMDQLQASYDGEIAFTDRHLGRFLGYLQESGLLERTIVIVTADHGEEFFDHGGYFHGCTLYEELVRVPLLVYVPGRRGRRVPERVSLVDLFPTVLDLLGRDDREGLELRGQSLLPLLAGEAWRERPIFAATEFRGPVRYAVIHRDHKLVVDLGTGRRELYDLERDPGEGENLLASGRGRELAEALERRFAEVDGPLRLKAPDAYRRAGDESGVKPAPARGRPPGPASPPASTPAGAR